MKKTFLALGLVGLIAAGCSNSTSQTSTSNDQGAQAPTSVTTTSDQAEKTINVQGGMYYFNPSQITVNKGDKVKIVFTNKNGFHDFNLDEFNVHSSKISGGSSTTVEFTADKTGSFEYYCSVGNHRQMGMKGTLVVK